MYGFGADFHWKDLTLSFLFKGSAKVDYYRSGLGNDAGWIPFYNGELGNVIKLANNPKNRWTPAWYSGTTATENPHAEFPRLSYGGNTNNSQPFLFLETERFFPALSGTQSEVQPEDSMDKKDRTIFCRSGVCCQQPFYYRQSEVF